MKNTQPHIKRDQAQTRQLPKLQPLKLEQLEGVAGGPGGDDDGPGDDYSGN